MLRSALLVAFLPWLACQSSAPVAPAAADSAEPALEIRVVRLQHLRAEALAPLLREILLRNEGGQAADASGVAMATRTGFKVAVQATTNSLVLSGTRPQIVEATAWIASVDVPATPVHGKDAR